MEFPYVMSGIRKLVSKKFAEAKESSALTYYPTEVDLLKINGTSFQLRFSQALAHKPAADKGGKKAKVPYDPFDVPPKELFITDIEPVHKLVLNKFAIVPEHFILATRAFKEQTCLLEEADIAATFSLIQTWKREGGDLFAFFNCGEHSGASQRHRHVQFLPIERMQDSVTGTWTPILDLLVDGDNSLVPFMTFSEKIPINATSQQLHKIYQRLYERACMYTGVKSPCLEENTASQISFNLAMSDKTICICPRKAEGASLTTKDHTGFVALNGTFLAGTLLVKNELEWKTLRGDEKQLEHILRTIGYSTAYDNNKL